MVDRGIARWNSSPKCFAVDCTYCSISYGWFRVTLRRMASNSPLRLRLIYQAVI
jgi:hypothetical protein